jgi:hypothetical protein
MEVENTSIDVCPVCRTSHHIVKRILYCVCGVARGEAVRDCTARGAPHVPPFVLLLVAWGGSCLGIASPYNVRGGACHAVRWHGRCVGWHTLRCALAWALCRVAHGEPTRGGPPRGVAHAARSRTNTGRYAPRVGSGRRGSMGS